MEIERKSLMIHMDPKDASRIHKFTGGQLAELLSKCIKLFTEYQQSEPEGTAGTYAINEIFAGIDRHQTELDTDSESVIW